MKKSHFDRTPLYLFFVKPLSSAAFSLLLPSKKGHTSAVKKMIASSCFDLLFKLLVFENQTLGIISQAASKLLRKLFFLVCQTQSSTRLENSWNFLGLESVGTNQPGERAKNKKVQTWKYKISSWMAYFLFNCLPRQHAVFVMCYTRRSEKKPKWKDSYPT